MNINRLFRSFLVALLMIWLPLVSTAGEKVTILHLEGTTFFQDKKDKKQEQGKDKKPEVKEVPQSRKQEKPEEVKKDDRSKENKGKN